MFIIGCGLFEDSNNNGANSNNNNTNNIYPEMRQIYTNPYTELTLWLRIY